VLLDRTRDVDTAVRRLVYAVVLSTQPIQPGAPPGPGHPRALSITQRELLVRNGLGDREAVVRAAAGRMLGAWVDAASAPTGGVKKEEEKTVMEDLLAFLGMFDLAEGTVAEDALASVFTTRPELFDALEFGGMYPPFSYPSISEPI
jgi:condensin complex subunit 3